MPTTDESTLPPEAEQDAVSGARILPGVVLTWSDDEHVARPTAVEAVLRPLVERHSPGRVLLAGARSVPLVACLPDDTVVDVLVRGVPDAGEASDASGLHPASRVFAGGIDAFTADEPYDLVVALGGPTRLVGPDGDGIGHAALVERLAGLLAPDGILVLDLANALGLDDLVAAAPRAPEDSNDLWHVGAVGFDPRPPVLPEVGAMLDAAGLRPVRTYAALPDLDRSSLLVALDRSPADDAVRARARQAVVAAAAQASTATLRDPRAVAGLVVDADGLDRLAPAWLVVAGREAAPEAPSAALPAVVETEPFCDPRWSRVLVLDGTGATSVAWADGRHEEVTAERALSRTLDLPRTEDGPTLDTALREACAARRHGAVRDLVRRYAAWLADPDVWTPETVPTRPFAVPTNVAVLDDGSFSVVDPSWRLNQEVDEDTILVLGLRSFARGLLASAAPHPWRTDSTPDALTYTLAAMTAVVPAETTIVAAAELEATVESLRGGRPQMRERILRAGLEEGRTSRNLPAASAAGFRELLMRDRRQARRLRERDAQVAWLEGTLRHRDRYIRELENVIERFEETVTYKTVQALRTPRRAVTNKAVATAKETVREALPPGAFDKARAFARKRLS